MQVPQTSQGQIDGLLGRVNKLYADLSLVNNQMEKKMMALSGSWPAAGQNSQKDDPQEDTLVCRFHDALRHFENEVRRTMEIADRLNEL